MVTRCTGPPKVRSLLVDFNSAPSISEAAMRVLDTPQLQADLELRTRACGRRLLWTEVGRTAGAC